MMQEKACLMNVVISTLNSLKTLGKCLRSIIGQDMSHDRLEAVLADAGPVMASKLLEYTIRKGYPALTRYFALFGINDPLCLFSKKYGRFYAITGSQRHDSRARKIAEQCAV